MIIEYYDTYEYREQLLLLMDSDSKLQFLAAATFLGGHSLIVTLYMLLLTLWTWFVSDTENSVTRDWGKKNETEPKTCY